MCAGAVTMGAAHPRAASSEHAAIAVSATDAANPALSRGASLSGRATSAFWGCRAARVQPGPAVGCVTAVHSAPAPSLAQTVFSPGPLIDTLRPVDHDLITFGRPEGTAAAADILNALAQRAAPVAVADASGILVWFTTSFGELWSPGLAVGARLADLHTALSVDTEDSPRPFQFEIIGHDRQVWQLDVRPVSAGYTVIQAERQPLMRSMDATDDRQSERLELVQEFSNTGVFERDVATFVGNWDRHMYRIWGLPDASPAAPSYDVVNEMMFSEDRQPGAFRQTFKHQGPHEQRIRILRPDGEVRHLHTRWKVYFDKSGAPTKVLGTNTDITELFNLADRAERLRTKLQVALELGRIALWRHDIASGMVFLDERASEMLGIAYRDAGVPPVEVRERVHPDDLPLGEASAQQTLRTGEPSDMEMRLRQTGGGWRHVLARRALQRDPDGQLLGFVGVMMDVTDRVEESRLALESARRLDAAANAARIGLWSTQLGTTLPRWNQRMYELFGLQPAAGPLPFQDWLVQCVHGEDRARVQDVVLNWWRNGNGEASIEFRVVRPSDGALRWLLVRGRLDAVGPGPSMRAEGIALDISDQQQTLRQLSETVKRMSLTTRALGLGTWSATRDHREVNWDAQMFKLRGLESTARLVSPEEIVSYVHPEQRHQVIGDQLGRVRDAQPWYNTFRVLWPDGTVRWITSHSVPVFNDQGELDGRIGVNWDSTESHLATEALREREIAVAENRAKSKAMSRIGHELRTPLNAILGFTQLMQLELSHIDPEKQARWLAHVEDAGRHLLSLINDVLELSRVEAGELKLDSKPVAWASVVAATLPLVTNMARERSIDICQLEIAGSVMGDPVRLRQVLINLISNAIKYTRIGGTVRVWTEVHKESVSLHVADNGTGIAPELLLHAFEPFNRLGAESTGVEGSGIGLTIVKALVEHMAGEVHVQSQPGEGSEFIVHLPVAPIEVDTSVKAGGRQEAVVDRGHFARRVRVLYIEDNSVNVFLVREMLALRPSVELDVAENGLTGIDCAVAAPPDLVLIDMQLPDIDGLAVLKLLQADPRTAGVRCVALSANADDAYVATALSAGFADYWTKPIDLRRFLQGIDRLLAHQSRSSAVD